ncbi:MAG: hypothetical protein PHD11_05435 [Bacteroidales bacterium]|nr:hypothetical protein [Bacteroidales bacterium]MDD4669966.1 hypothetical protein [Bacteroidales bacterium]
MNEIKRNNSIISAIETDKRSVFRLSDVAMLVNEFDFDSINYRLNYAVRTGKLLNPRKGIYTKPEYKFEELACLLYTPVYISFQSVLYRSGVIARHDGTVTLAGYLSRNINIDDKNIRITKLKGEILVSTYGVAIKNDINIATPERAFLDTLYIDSNAHFDNLSGLNKKKICEMLPLYGSKTIAKRAKQLLKDGEQ